MQLLSVAAGRPGADHQCGYGDDQAEHQQRRFHRVQERGLAEFGESASLRAKRFGDLQGLSQRMGGRAAYRTRERRQMRGEDMGISRREDRAGHATPRAAPTSRVVSLTAEATPCFSSGTAVMIANVLGAVQNPMPVLITSIGHITSQYGESICRTRIQRNPAEISSSPRNVTSRRPIRGRYHGDSTDNVSMGAISGLSANAVWIGL